MPIINFSKISWSNMAYISAILYALVIGFFIYQIVKFLARNDEDPDYSEPDEE